jgi:hypothetical protein
MGVRSADGPRTRLAVPRPRSNRLSFAFRPRIRAVNEMLARRGVSDRDGNAPTSRRSASSSPRAADEDQDHARFRLRRAAPAVERGGITHVKSSRCARRSPRRCDARVIAVREYRLIVEGELSDELSPSFKGMALTREGGNTMLVGRVRDQARASGVTAARLRPRTHPAHGDEDGRARPGLTSST